MATEKKAVLVRFYPEIHQKLQSIARKNKRTVTNLVEYLVENSLSQFDSESKNDVFSYSKANYFHKSGNDSYLESNNL